ncbi:MAG: LOG family protein [Dehalococcoidaceae bacterium]|nr:LOG family protein [Dehalococcoidaceae bacterium]
MKIEKRIKPGELLKLVGEVAHADGSDLRTLLYQDLIVNALKCKRDELNILDLKVINRALAEFRYAARVFKPYRGIRKVSIFGSARTTSSDPYYSLARELGRLLSENNYMVITGASEGIMRAGIEGAGASSSFGVNILLPFESGPTSIIRDDPKVMRFKYFFTRKLFFVMEANAFALLPGGFGTHDEGFEVLTLLQTGKSPPMPVVLMELEGENYWESWDAFIRQQLLSRSLISPEDLSFYKIVYSPAEAVSWINHYYSTYHSLRQVEDSMVIRLERVLSDNHILELNQLFKDIITSGDIRRSDPLSAEEDEPALLEKPRLAFKSNRKSAGRLNQMILLINELGKDL